MLLIDLFNVSLALLVLAIVAFVVRAVGLTKASISNASRHLNLTQPEVARRLVEEIRARNVPCERCGQQTFAMLGTGDRYKCETCHVEFQGPPHMPPDIPRVAPRQLI